MTPVVGEKLPALQGKQPLAADRFEYVPAAQATHTDAPKPDELPAGQTLHVRAAPMEYSPDVQSVHAVDAESEEYEPAAHCWHAETPTAVEKVPGWQRPHVVSIPVMRISYIPTWAL